MSRRWLVLAVGTAAQATQAAVLSGLAVLAPSLQHRFGLTLGEVGLLLGSCGAGAIATMLPWGLAADRFGERVTAAIGLTGAAAGLAGAAAAGSFWLLLVALAFAGAFGASTQSATGRAVTGWFSREQRGLALSIRQTAIPIGGLAAGVVLPQVVSAAGPRAALTGLAGASAVAAVAAGAFLAEGPPHDEAPAAALDRHPLRDSRLWRLSFGSGLLVATQVIMLGFVVVFLENARGFSTAGAAAVLAGINVVGGVGRLASGRLSDVRGTRLAPMRRIAVATAGTTVLVATLVRASPLVLAPALVAAVEYAGRARSGVGVGLQQTALGVAGALTPIAFGPFVAATSWRAGFAAAAAFPLLGLAALRGLRDERAAQTAAARASASRPPVGTA